MIYNLNTINEAYPTKMQDTQKQRE